MAYKMLRLLPLMTNTIDSSNNGVDKIKRKLITRRHYQVLGAWLYGRVLWLMCKRHWVPSPIPQEKERGGEEEERKKRLKRLFTK